MSDRTNDIESVLKPHVKNTANELPEPMVPVLVWTGMQWCYAWLDNDQWENDTDYCSLNEGEYWLPLPTFDPSEVSCKD